MNLSRPTALNLATIVAILAGCAALISAGATLAFLGPLGHSAEWLSAWATYAYAIISFWLFVGGAAATVAFLWQVREARLSREAQLRPVLVVVSADAAEDNERTEVTIQNVGPGPALNVRLQAWLPAAPSVWSGIVEWEERARHAEQVIERGKAPLFESQPRFVLASGWKVALPLWWSQVPAGPQPHDLVFFRIEYDDIFGTTLSEPMNPGRVRHSFSGDPQDWDFEPRFAKA